jgi:hypothetical protein
VRICAAKKREVRMPGEQRNGAGGLEGLVTGASTAGRRPVDAWNPPHCGDIGLKIRKDGVWLYRGSPIDRPALVKLFASVLRREADGRYFLMTPAEKVDVKVEDVPFLAVEMTVEGVGREQALFFRTNVDDVVHCGPAHPLLFALEAATGGLRPYVLVRGHLKARVTRTIYLELVALALAAKGEGGAAPGIWSGGAFFPLAPTETSSR